ncbi:uncharacterized protein LOC114354496 isoform X1 [Ostrinia furnacalis]|uniref:uncharacterized protein LOC114354496 isoform X1 n=2 Tax=Ostrinia furnacalis TaxID=93504 RepID=UPI00103B3134|nr:uncharacterized protein LOC114354496 isoform X1 [Ostrinia furnacalis]XP_028162709.1 uncharacterized protein LOC114354496 isoform X1 [Ostrinia furnacalis]
MSTPGRGRGYTGRHHLREPRPGDDPADLDAARTLAELSPRATVVTSAISEPRTEVKEKSEDTEKEDVGKEVKQEVKYHVNIEDEGLKELLTIDEQFRPLLVLLEQFSLGEDGIQFNRKLRHFESTVTTMCPDEARLQQAFATFRAAALCSSVTARKLAAVGASFTRQQRQQLLRGALLNVVMQGTFSKLDVLERANPQFLINASNLMGDYFAEARLCNGNKVHILASPLLQYMRALLASDDIRAHRSLATQLMQNGRELLSQHTAQELDDLSISIRLRLLSPPPVSIIWLLLSADLCLNKFLPLPNTLQQFYASHLELTPDENYSEVSYGSWKKSPEKDEYRSDVSTDSVAEKASQNVSQISLSDDIDTKPKLRPILGAGAGLLRQEQALSVSQDTFETWTAKSSLSKRYDLNSWRQAEDEKEVEEPVFNPAVLPPNFPVTVPDYPPPTTRFSYPENMANYLQQGDGAYIQNQYPANSTANFNQQGDTYQFAQNERPQPEKVNNEIQKNAQNRRPIENWRREKSDLKEDANRNRQRNWTRQRSKDNIDDDDDKEKFKDGEKFPRSSSRNSRESRPGNRMPRRNSGESSESVNTNSGKTPPRRHVTDVPRNQKYWDHDDRCDKDYNS